MTSDGKKRRALTPDERALAEFLLSTEFPGRKELVLQLESARVTRECECGCGTVNLAVEDDLPRAVCREPIPVEAHGAGVDVLLFVRKGLLACLEIVHHDDARPQPYPRPSNLRLRTPPHKSTETTSS